MADSMSFHSMQMGANGVGVVSVVDETKTFARFLIEPKLMVFESENTSVPVFENREYIIVHHPGERDPVKKEASEFDRRRWPQAYTRFKEGLKEAPPGTNLAVLFPASPNIPATFSMLGIITIEQLARVADSALGNMPFGFDARKKAQEFLEQQEGAQGFNKLQAELQKKDTEIRSLELRMSEMAEQMMRLKPDQPATAAAPGLTAADVAAIVQAALAGTKRGPGRPSKEEAA